MKPCLCLTSVPWLMHFLMHFAQRNTLYCYTL